MASYEQRFAERKNELEWLYMELYNSRQALDTLENVMRDFAKARSAELNRLDAKREKDPQWYLSRKMLGVTMYTRLFAGSLKKLAEKLDYLQQQGITYLHLMPLLKMPHPDNDGGYAVEDFNTVDPLIGSNADLEALTTQLRKRGISLCLDFVVNHTADTHDWAVRAKNGDGEYISRYMCYDDRRIPDEFERTMPQVFPTTAPGNFTWNNDMHKWVLTTFYPFQWDLNYRNPVVLNEMVFSMLRLANMGVEVLRIDAVPYIWKTLGTNCRNLPEVHTIMRIVRLITECVCPAVILKGEVVMAPNELAAYFGTPEKPECHVLYNVSTMVNLWGALASSDTRLLKMQLDALHSLPPHCRFVNYLRCHDDIGWGLDEYAEKQLGIDPLAHKKYLYHFFEGKFDGSFARGELYNYDPMTQDARTCGTTASLCGIEKGGFERDEAQVSLGIQRDLMMHAAMFSLNGFPMLSSGDEIGQVNGYNYKSEPAKAADSRNLHRTAFNWQHAALRTKKGTVQQRIWDGLRKLEAARAAEPCFDKSAEVSTWDTHNNSVLAIVRKRGENTLICLANFSAYEQTAHLDAIAGDFNDLLSTSKTIPDSITLKPYEYSWYKK